MSLLAGYSKEDKLATVERRADLNGHLDYEKYRSQVNLHPGIATWRSGGFSMYCRTARDTIFEENNNCLQLKRIFMVSIK